MSRSENDTLLISVIVPIYNAEKYLEESLNSIQTQVYRDFEPVMMDDGSQDESSSICDEYALLDKRFIAVHKVNAGPSVAREIGKELAFGGYVTFLDSDDWFENSCFSMCETVIKENNSPDCVLFSYLRETESESKEVHLFESPKVFEGKDEVVNRIHHRFFGLSFSELNHPERMENIVTCWAKIYRKDVANRGHFTDIRKIGSAEDAMFNIYALDGCQKIVYMDECLIHYRKHSATLTSTYNPDLIEQWKVLFDIMSRIIDEKDYSEIYTEALCTRISISMMSIGLNELANHNHNIFEHIRTIRQYLNCPVYRFNCRKLKVKSMPISWKVFMLSCKLRLSLVVFLELVCMRYIRKRKRK